MPVLDRAKFTLRSEEDPRTVLRALAAWPWFEGRPPDVLEANYKALPIDDQWVDRVPFEGVRCDMDWGPLLERYIRTGKQRDLQVVKRNTELTPSIALDLLRTVPFETAVGVSPHVYDWSTAFKDKGTPLYVPRSGWGMGHAGHGWACFLRGRGHEQVVSRRFLHHGPWRTVYLPGEDLTMVQFHDLDADLHTAVQQARPGHEVMGYTGFGYSLSGHHGIFFHRGPAHPHPEITGTYDRRSKTFSFHMVEGQRLPIEIANLGWFRLHNRDGRGELKRPVETIRLVYTDEARARADLELAWRCEFEVACVLGGEEIRLDEGYASTWEAPDWVKRLQDKEGF